jgi:hypothetical protein
MTTLYFFFPMQKNTHTLVISIFELKIALALYYKGKSIIIITREAVKIMSDEKNCGGNDEAKKAEWKEKYAKMSDSEKKEMLNKKKTHLTEKMAWVEEELKKLA